MSKLVEGYLRALRGLCPHTEGGVYYRIGCLPPSQPIQDQINQFYHSEGWSPELSSIDPHDFPNIFASFVKDAIPHSDNASFIGEFVEILNEEYCPFEIYGELDVFDGGASFVLLLDRDSERVLIDLGFTYD